MIPYLNYDLLKKINANSIRAGRNQNLVFRTLPIERDELYPVVFSTLHNDIEVRTKIILNSHGGSVLLDMSIEEFNLLPRFDGQNRRCMASGCDATEDLLPVEEGIFHDCFICKTHVEGEK